MALCTPSGACHKRRSMFKRKWLFQVMANLPKTNLKTLTTLSTRNGKQSLKDKAEQERRLLLDSCKIRLLTVYSTLPRFTLLSITWNPTRVNLTIGNVGALTLFITQRQKNVWLINGYASTFSKRKYVTTPQR